ncbi:glycosyltransferase [Candidatus Pacearchaeota archaeon]|nr:glycosyltransferase [Candidatus Pacearchaeota archaeon]
MKVSLICPVYNERESISCLIESMLNQSKKPDEIIFVDSFSEDGTSEIIKEYSINKKRIRLIQKKSNIAEARNIAIKNSKYEIIAATDASSKLDKDWLKNITRPFKDKTIDVVAGGYEAISNGGIEDYLAMLTVKPMNEWDKRTFLPSGRSIAFKKKAWKAVGGYPENLYTGEDTLFDLKLKERGFKFKLEKRALIYWRGRNTIKKFIKQFWLYGKGDSEARNLKKMRSNLIFFLGMNFYLFFLITGFIINPIISLCLLAPLFVYLEMTGIKYTFKEKRIGCLFWIPILLFLKRFSYFFGVWRGLLK